MENEQRIIIDTHRKGSPRIPHQDLPEFSNEYRNGN
jgi:hypothetical protein